MIATIKDHLTTSGLEDIAVAPVSKKIDGAWADYEAAARWAHSECRNWRTDNFTHEDFEAVFVVDGSPDNSFLVLRDALPEAGFNAQLISLSRNFGAFAAIRAGMEKARGARMAVMANTG